MVRNRQHVKKLLEIETLIDGSPIEITYHPTSNQRRCVVSCREVLLMSEDELVNELKNQNVINVKRITRKDPTRDENVPTPTLILTIQGTVIPEVIYFGFIRIPTRNYYPNPMQCFVCYRFGHTSKKFQKQIQLCWNCGQAHHEKEDKVRACDASTSCVNCGGNHPSTSRKCPTWIIEDKITRIRIDQGISYKEARVKYDALNNGPTYASKVQERINVIQKGGCNYCKCNCLTATLVPKNSTEITTETETETESLRLDGRF